MLKEDFVIQSQIRRILVRSDIDYSKLSFGTVKGVVYIRGIFEMTRVYTDGSEGGIQEFIKKNLHSLEKKIKDIPGVIDVNFELANWIRERGKWTQR